jgi:hypothetical protein
MFPDSSGAPVEMLLKAEVMVEPIVWLCSDDSDGVNSMRFRGALWDSSHDRPALIEKAGAPVAWTQLGAQAIYPDD